MDGFLDLAPILAILASAVAAVAVPLTGEKRRNLRETWTIIAAVVKFSLIAMMIPGVLAGERYGMDLLEIAPGIGLSFRVDPAGLLFATSASFLWILTSFYAFGYMRGAKEAKQSRFFSMLAVCLSATIGLCFSGNILTFVLFYEILSVATYPLVIHSGSKKAYEIGRQYLIYALGAGMSLVAGLTAIYAVTGTLEFQPGGFLDAEMGTGFLWLVFILFAIGFGMKAGVIPLQSWLPNAMIAPTPVSALLHAVAVVKAGVFGFVRLVGYMFGPELFAEIGAATVLAIFAAVTILVASLIAITKDDLKARLAYSTVGHLSYIVLGIAILAPQAMLGAAFHMITHAAMKITLFFCAGAIYVHTKKTKVSQLDGIGRQMPLTMAAFGVGAVGLAGVPLVGGFVSKWYLGVGALDAGLSIYLWVFLLSGLLNAAYLVPIVTRAFLRSSPDHTRFNEASPLMVVPITITMLFALLLGIHPDGVFRFFSLAEAIVASVTGVTFTGGI